MSDDQQQGAVHLSSDNFQQTLDSAGMPVFVDFYADWCGPCKLAAPVIDKLAGEMKDKIKITKLNVDENNDVAAKFGVMSIPTVVVFDADGKEVDRKVGFPGEQGYRDMISKVVGA